MAHMSILYAQADADTAQQIASTVRGRGGEVSLVMAEDGLPPSLAASALVILLVSRHFPYERLQAAVRLIEDTHIPSFAFLLDDTPYPGAARENAAPLLEDERGFGQFIGRLLRRRERTPELPAAFLRLVEETLRQTRAESTTRARPPSRGIPEGYGEDAQDDVPARGGELFLPPKPVPPPQPITPPASIAPAPPPAPTPSRPAVPGAVLPPPSVPAEREAAVREEADVRDKADAKDGLAQTPRVEEEGGALDGVFGGVAAPDTEAADPVAFSAYTPRELKPDTWQPLKVYAYRTSALGQVEADAEAALGAAFTDFRPTRADSGVAIAEGALITAAPDVPGLQFNPPSASVSFFEDWHRLDFKLRVKAAPLHQAANGRITFTVEGVIAAELPLSIYITDQPTQHAPALTPAKPYRAVFCSYSHTDTPIVERVERAVKLLGYDYLRDATKLRSGEDWNAALLRMIDDADIFQLFWSNRSSESRYVRQEWEYALARMTREGIPAFIRPVYWQQPMPNPPSELGHLHFAFDDTLDDGVGG